MKAEILINKEKLNQIHEEFGLNIKNRCPKGHILKMHRGKVH